jgi:hypothetical protein
MAARRKFSNFEMNFGGVDWNKVWHTMVVVVCKIELVCKNPKWAQS